MRLFALPICIWSSFYPQGDEINYTVLVDLGETLNAKADIW